MTEKIGCVQHDCADCQGAWECQFAERLGGWVVEKVGSDGECYVTQFYGADAERRAKHYQRVMRAIDKYRAVVAEVMSTAHDEFASGGPRS